MFVIQNLEGAYAGRCRVGEASPNGWESVLAGLHSYSNASSGEDLFSLRNLNQNEEIFRDISLLANQWARAYVFHDPSFPWFLVVPSFTTWLKQLSCSLFSFPLHPYPW